MTAKARQRRETEWIVLEHVEREASGGDEAQPDFLPAIEAWRIAGTHTGNSKAGAIKAVAGEQTGAFKAVAASAWKGGLVLAQETLVTSKPIDD